VIERTKCTLKPHVSHYIKPDHCDASYVNKQRSNSFTGKKLYRDKKSIALYSSAHTLCRIYGLGWG